MEAFLSFLGPAGGATAAGAAGTAGTAASGLGSLVKMFDSGGSKQAMQNAQKLTQQPALPQAQASAQKPMDLGLLSELLKSRSRLGT